MEETMADENVGLDLASQTGQEDIVEAINGLKNLLSRLSDLVTLGSKTVTEGGTYNPEDDGLDGYSSFIVDIPSAPVFVSKSITQNGTYNASDDDADGYSEVTVNIQNNIKLTKIMTQGKVSTASNYASVSFEEDISGYNIFVVDMWDGGEITSTYTLVLIEKQLPVTFDMIKNGSSQRYTVNLTNTTIGTTYYNGSYRELFVDVYAANCGITYEEG
jgi:hypothetical protein